MNWRVDFHDNARKFLIKNKISSEEIAEFNFDELRVYIEAIDWRGSVYKK